MDGLPPYGPVRGMLDGVLLMERLAPDTVDRALLKQHGIAPGNEYKVLHALRYLGLVDAEGRATPNSRLLRTRGATRTEGLRRLVARAYADLLGQLDLETASRDDVHNYFVTRHNLSRDLAAKAAGFFLELCRMAGLPAAPPGGGASLPPAPDHAAAWARRAEAFARSRPEDDTSGHERDPEDGSAAPPVRTGDQRGPTPIPFPTPERDRTSDTRDQRRRADGPRPVAGTGFGAPPPGPVEAAELRVSHGAPNRLPAPSSVLSGGEAGPIVTVTLADIESRSETELAALFRRLRRAWQQSADPAPDERAEPLP